MSMLAQIMLWLFMAAWCVGAATYLCQPVLLSDVAAGFRTKPHREGYGRKALIGYGIFVCAILVALAAGGIAELAGGWD